MIKAIIFDFDGVIIQSEDTRFYILRQIFIEHGLELQESHRAQMLGHTTTNFLTQLGVAPETIAAIMTKVKKMREDIVNLAEPIDMTVDFIKSHNGVKFGIASSATIYVIEKVTQIYGIRDRFTTIIGRESVDNLKPSPDSYLAALAALGLPATECVAIEDTPVGAQAAITAGLRCYILINGTNDVDVFKDMPIAGFIRSREDFEKILK